jgi:Cu-processing system ATP-binding protein
MSNPNSPLVSLKQVSKKYQQISALTQVDLELNQGEVLGLFGHNGAGKTTLMKLILGVISPTGGELNVMDVKPDSKAAWHIRQKIGYLPENVSFYDQMTGLEVLTYFAKLKGYNKKTAINLLEQVGISYAMNRPVKTYSKGMRQRLGLAQAFIGEPQLLLLDEPTVGLDPIATQEFYQQVDLLKQRGASIILCSHVLPGVEQHLDRAMVMSAGHPLAIGSLAQLRTTAQLPVTIKAQGLNGALVQDNCLAEFLSQDKQALLVPEQKKLSVLKHLLSQEKLTDISVEPASLELLYQHFLSSSPISPLNSPSGAN